jgi:hypothetical protein
MTKRKAVPIAAGAVAVMLVGFMVFAMTVGGVSGASTGGQVRSRAGLQGMRVTTHPTITVPQAVSAGSTDDPSESPDLSGDRSESDDPTDDSTQSPESSDDASEIETTDTSDDQTSSDESSTGVSTGEATDDLTETSATSGDD